MASSPNSPQYLTPTDPNVGAISIGEENPAGDFRALVAGHCDKYNEIIQNNFDVLLKEVRNRLWKLLFENETKNMDNSDKTFELLREVRKSAINYGPEKYNAVIIDVRTELNARSKESFWQQIAVQGLGLILPELEGQPIADTVVTFPRSEAEDLEKYGVPAVIEISFENPNGDFENLIKKYCEIDDYVSDSVTSNNFKQISLKAMSTVWDMLFGSNATAETRNKAIDLLEATRTSCCFYSPYDFNDFIPKVRDELLKNNMLNFWREGIVKRELGLIGPRDSDYFDDLSDPKPAKFYEHGGCKAPFTIEENDSD